MQIQINASRLEYLLKLFKLSKEDLQREINEKIDFDKPLTKTILKKIDDVFKMGLDFYTNPLQIDTQNSSILFRKANFNDKLEIGDIQFITQYEKDIHYIKSLAKLGNFAFTKRKLKYFSLADSPLEVAREMQSLLPKKISKIKNF